jgi:hypothetical protein
MLPAEVRRHRFDVEEYHRMGELAFYPRKIGSSWRSGWGGGRNRGKAYNPPCMKEVRHGPTGE